MYKRILRLRDLAEMQMKLRRFSVHTVCEEARCPNRSECFARGVATFLLMGDRCTRRCGFCSISTGKPLPLDPDEPRRVAEVAKALGLSHVILTSVNRDDLEDGGSRHFILTIREVRKLLPRATVEVLTPDFRGNLAAVAALCAEKPEVFNHNVETVPRLYPLVRPGARYERSLRVLAEAARLLPGGVIKSGIMVGHGESFSELSTVFRQLRSVGVNALTIGQYFQPTAKNLPVQRYCPPSYFAELKEEALRSGIPWVFAGPYVRSSYLADHALLWIRGKGSLEGGAHKGHPFPSPNPSNFTPMTHSSSPS